ncbi:MAG: hypothetical protein EBQ95_03665 [Gammaproteobacteria bacterium]|nr:hypothetical protein [Gammaproteobacteria bacterium]
MVQLAQHPQKITGYSLLECLLTLFLLQALMWMAWPSIKQIELRWKAQQVLSQIHQVVEWTRWNALLKHQIYAIEIKANHLEVFDIHHKRVKATSSWDKDIHVRWHGFQTRLPLVFESELSELHLNGIWEVLIKNQVYHRYIMNRLGHGHVEG